MTNKLINQKNETINKIIKNKKKKQAINQQPKERKHLAKEKNETEQKPIKTTPKETTLKNIIKTKDDSMKPKCVVAR